MAAIAVRTLPNSGKPAISVEESYQQIEGTAAATLTAGTAVRYDANGRFVAAGATGAVLGIITNNVVAGDGCTAIRKGKMDGYNLDALAYGAQVWAGASGAPDTAGVAGTNPEIGFVMAGRSNLRGNAPDKILFIDITNDLA
jgi:hypothetical protein